MDVVSVNPFRCHVWDLHNRMEEYLTEESCRKEIRSFLEHGQLIPALGRRRKSNSDEIELICGIRRLFVARHLNKPLLVELRELSDVDAIIAMDLENRQRQDLSPYERGMGYARWLRSGHFASQEKLASALRVSPAHVSRLMRIARLPTVVLDAFGGAVHICEQWGLTLAAALEDPASTQRVLKAAREISAKHPRPLAQDVYRQLLSSSVRGRRPRMPLRDTVIKGEDGVPLFRIRHQRDTIALVLPIDRVSAKSLDVIQRAVTRILQPAFGAEPSELSLRRAAGSDVVDVPESTLSS